MEGRWIFFGAFRQSSSSFGSVLLRRWLIWGVSAGWFGRAGWFRVAGLPMKSSLKRKCRHCKLLYVPERRNAHHQRYCCEPACRRQSKAESQRRWREKPQNQNYFRGEENCERVREWRKRHPGYSRKKKSAPGEALQDLCMSQPAQSQPLADPDLSEALQDVFVMQPAVIVGLISTMTGSALQDDIATVARALFRKGKDILGPNAPAQNPAYRHEQTSPLSSAAAPCAASI
jgi:hypothetical protein